MANKRGDVSFENESLQLKKNKKKKKREREAAPWQDVATLLSQQGCTHLMLGGWVGEEEEGGGVVGAREGGLIGDL